MTIRTRRAAARHRLLLPALALCATATASAAAIDAWCPVDAASAARAPAPELIARALRQVDEPPHALAHLHTQGTLPHQGIHDASVLAERDFPRLRDAAIAWRLSGDKRLLAQVDAYLAAWSSTYVPSFDPIDETKLDGLIEAYTLTAPALSTETREKVRDLLGRFARGYIERIEGRAQDARARTSSTWTNNWQSHRIKVLTMAAAALDDAELMAIARELYLRQLAANIRPDGSVIDFYERDALHYVVYDLEPLTAAALAARPYGTDWLTLKASNGATLAGALDWLQPFALGAQTHEEFVHTTVAFDRTRADAGLSGFGGLWQPKGAANLYWDAARLDPRYRTVAEHLSPAEGSWQSLCQP